MQKYNLFRKFARGLRKKHLRICAIRLFLLVLTTALGLAGAAGTACAESSGYGCLIFNEIMYDPEPVVGLPNVEYVELHNTTDAAVNLVGWVFLYDNRPFRLPAYTLSAGGYVILCGNAGAVKFDSTVSVLPVPSFPVLARTNKIVTLTTPQGDLVNSLTYSDAWYEDAFKRKGGWSLECVDADNLSGDGSNWRASTDSTGGTPGRKNAVAAPNPDTKKPACNHLSVPNAATLKLRFSKRMDVGWLSDVSNFKVAESERVTKSGKMAQGWLSIEGVNPSYPLYKEVELTLSRPLQEGEIIGLTLMAPNDVSGNVSVDTFFQVGLPLKPEPFELTFNELLFNPDEAGCDYVEVVNRSQRCLDLSQVWLCGRDEDGTLQEGCRLYEEVVPALPGSYWVLSSTGDSLAKRYGCDSISHFPSLKGFPSMPDESGTVVLVTTDNCVIDECSYSADWHMPLFSDKEGIALEKLHPDKPSNEADAWLSASSLSGYGTPGRRNSQYTASLKASETFMKLDRTWLTPNGDGREDLLTVALNVGEPGTVSLTLYNLSGVAVCHWLRSQWVGVGQEINWDGTDEKGSLLPSGRYILLATLTRTNGTIQTAKTVVTVL